MGLTRIELEQIRNSREYFDDLAFGSQAENGVDFNSDFNFAISAIRRIIFGNASGVGNWYDSVPASLSELAAVSGVGTKETWTEVFNNGSGILDASSFDIDITLGGSTTYFLSDSLGTKLYEVNDSQNSIRNLGRRTFFLDINNDFNEGSTITIPDNIIYTPDSEFRNLEVRRNGNVLLPGSGISSGDENYNDYRETSSSGIVINFKLKKKEVLEFRTFG